MTEEIHKVQIKNVRIPFNGYIDVFVIDEQEKIQKLSLSVNWKIPTPIMGQTGIAKIQKVLKGDSYITPLGENKIANYDNIYLIDFMPDES